MDYLQVLFGFSLWKLNGLEKHRQGCFFAEKSVFL